jgi:hypothetical protein
LRNMGKADFRGQVLAGAANAKVYQRCTVIMFVLLLAAAAAAALQGLHLDASAQPAKPAAPAPAPKK